jgi:hypothetical protein
VNTRHSLTVATTFAFISACGGLQSPPPASAPAAAPAPVAAVAAPAPAPAPTPTPPPPPPILPFDEAVLSAATALLKNAKLPPEGTAAQPRDTVVIDPLIDGANHAQTATTLSMGLRLAALMREMYRICFALADLKSGKLVSKGLAVSKPDGVDATPTASYRDAPA